MKKHGFTLIEMVIVIVLAGILAAMALPRVVNSSDNAKRQLNNATAATLNTSAAAVIARSRIPGTAVTATTTAAPYSHATSTTVYSVENNPNINPNNYVGYAIPGSGCGNCYQYIISGAGRGTYSTTPNLASSVTAPNIPYSDLNFGNYLNACVNIFNALIGDNSVQASTSTNSTYQVMAQSLTAPPSGKFSLINGQAYTNFVSKNSSYTNGLYSSGVMTASQSWPGYGGFCVYQLNSSTSTNFYIFYDILTGLFGTAEQ